MTTEDLAPTIPDLPGAEPTRVRITRRRLVRIGLPTAVVIASVAVLSHSSGGGTPAAATTAGTVTAVPAAEVGLAPGDPAPNVDGCLGGKPGINAKGDYVDLDQIVLAAQKQATLTPTGAAEFTATLIRWVINLQKSPTVSVTARQIIDPQHTELLKQTEPSATKGAKGWTDFSDGRFSIDSFAPGTADVSWLATGRYTPGDAPLQQQTIGGTVHLVVVDGVWRYAGNLVSHLSFDELSRTSTAYEGGC